MLNETPIIPGRIEWLPAERLGQAKIDAGVRTWLIGKGLLTQRLKDVCGDKFSLRLLEQNTGLLDAAQRAALRSADAAGLFREVKMFCGNKAWVYARTIVPDSTLNRHPWLAELGDAALGETLSALSGVERSPYEYAWLPATDAVALRAVSGADIAPGGLWTRRYRFTLHGAPLLVQELFFPNVGQV
jgi:chorismate--pyruvate lyase